LTVDFLFFFLYCFLELPLGEIKMYNNNRQICQRHTKLQRCSQSQVIIDGCHQIYNSLIADLSCRSLIADNRISCVLLLINRLFCFFTCALQKKKKQSICTNNEQSGLHCLFQPGKNLGNSEVFRKLKTVQNLAYFSQ